MIEKRYLKSLLQLGAAARYARLAFALAGRPTGPADERHYNETGADERQSPARYVLHTCVFIDRRYCGRLLAWGPKKVQVGQRATRDSHAVAERSRRRAFSSRRLWIFNLE